MSTVTQTQVVTNTKHISVNDLNLPSSFDVLSRKCPDLKQLTGLQAWENAYQARDFNTLADHYSPEFLSITARCEPIVKVVGALCISALSLTFAYASYRYTTSLTLSFGIAFISGIIGMMNLLNHARSLEVVARDLLGIGGDFMMKFNAEFIRGCSTLDTSRLARLKKKVEQIDTIIAQRGYFAFDPAGTSESFLAIRHHFQATIDLYENVMPSSAFDSWSKTLR